MMFQHLKELQQICSFDLWEKIVKKLAETAQNLVHNKVSVLEVIYNRNLQRYGTKIIESLL